MCRYFWPNFALIFMFDGNEPNKPSQTTYIFHERYSLQRTSFNWKQNQTENGKQHDTKLCMQNMFIDSVLFRTSSELLFGLVQFNSFELWILFLSLFRVIDRMHLKVMLLHFHFPCATHKFDSKVLKELYESRHIFTYSLAFNMNVK